MQDGLVSMFEKGGARQYVAEEPAYLQQLVERRQRELKEAKGRLDGLIPMLSTLIWSEDTRPTVRYYHGKEGLKTMRSEMLRASQHGDIWYNFAPMDHLQRVFGTDDFLYDKQRLAMGIKSRTIFTTRSAVLKAAVLAVADKRRIERKFVSPKKFSSGRGDHLK